MKATGEEHDYRLSTDPAEYKRRNLGRWYATGSYPEPGHYS